MCSKAVLRFSSPELEILRPDGWMLASRTPAFTSFTVDKQHERYERVLTVCLGVCICMWVSLLVWSEASSNKALPSGSFGDRVHHHHTHTSPCQLALHTTHGLKISCNITVTHTHKHKHVSDLCAHATCLKSCDFFKLQWSTSKMSLFPL